MIFKRQTEIIPFGKFMAKKRTKEKPSIVVPALFPVITQHHLFPVQDPDFVLLMAGVGAITLSAFIERGLVMMGMIDVAEKVTDCGRVVFPVIVYGAVLWLFFSLGGM
ncbi:hypothetical protein [Geobacillus kaustophilus]|uniref:Uncharacterized protein n=1 Tax=Geobacillus kaustophilus (strain HTA426) TaxID=235909 RepID=Q5L2J3_GEOKA|nr:MULTISPECIES: hypothetical protein [Geobacillus thermoleovorans group]MBW7642401.1 hypothetical protein [Geobacillus thermoleovorans]BAD74837.1 hypothetical protein GK0552 [Geobacillus kaustophilus HTA426]